VKLRTLALAVFDFYHKKRCTTFSDVPLSVAHTPPHRRDASKNLIQLLLPFVFIYFKNKTLFYEKIASLLLITTLF